MRTIGGQTRTRLSLLGAAFVLVTFLVLMSAWNTGINLYYILFGGVGSFLLASWALSRRLLHGLELTREAPPSVERSEPFAVAVRIANAKRFTPALAVRIESDAQPGASQGFVLCIPPRREAVLTVMDRMDRRGVYRLPDVWACTRFPFGILERRRRLVDGAEVVVYPRVRALRPAALELAQRGGAVVRKTKGEGDEFFSLRDYVPGDDLRKVAWRASARMNRLLVKELQHGASRMVACVLDSRLRTDLDGFADLFEDAVDLTASLAVTLLDRQFTVMVQTATAYAPLGEGPGHAGKVLDMLARIDMADPSAPDPLLRIGADGRALRVLCISPDPGMWGRRAGTQGDVVIDPAEVLHA